ncbi:MAG: cupin domain-containing protein [Thermomicrobiales bacterium]
MPAEITAEELIALLDLQPLPGEGGYFRQTYIRESTGADVPLTTAILYLVTPDSFSGLHRLTHDELFHVYLGHPCEMVTFRDGGDVRFTTLGSDLRAGMTVQHLVPAGTWQGTRLVPGGQFALLGTTMTPGYDPAGFELATPDVLSKLPVEDQERVRPFLATGQV